MYYFILVDKTRGEKGEEGWYFLWRLCININAIFFQDTGDTKQRGEMLLGKTLSLAIKEL